MSLTTGVLKEIVCCNDSDSMPLNPVVQILGVKQIKSGKEGTQDRFRLVISDGENYYTSAMLATQLNHMVSEDSVEVKAVIKLNRYTCNIIQETRKVIIVLDLDIVQTAAISDGKIGNPEQLTDIVESHAQLRKVKKEPVPVNHNNNVYNNRAAANGMQKQSFENSMNGGNIFPIASLTPYQNKWRIRARVTNKSAIRTWSNSRGEGKLFSIDLVDESGEIKATAFNDACDRYFDTIEKGKVYYISKGSLRTANKQYTSLKNDYEMSINNDTTIELCNDKCDLPDIQYNFKFIKDIEQVNKDAFVDIIAVVKSVSDITQITTKANNRQVSKRDLTLVDQSASSINATLWGSEAEGFEEYATKNPVIAIKGAKVSDFGGRSLSIPNSAVFNINPDLQKAHELKGWFDNGGVNEQVSSLSGQRMEGMSGGKFKTIAQIKDENLGMGEKADYFNVRACAVFLRKENCMYQACPGSECNKKVIEESGQYRCEKCDRTYPDFKYRLILSSNISDFSGNQWITSFQESAEAILGTTAELLGNYRETDETRFNQVFADASFKIYNIKIRAKMETYQEEKRLKCSAVSAQPVKFKDECRRLLESIKQLEEM